MVHHALTHFCSLVGRLVTTVPSAVLRASKHLGPLIEERINTSDSTDAVKTVNIASYHVSTTR